jgi:hypothetical protein
LPDTTIGYSFLRAWPTDRIYHLFGDPATVLRLPRQSSQPLVVSPESLQPGVAFQGRALAEIPEARYAWTLFGPRRMRNYRSTRGEIVYQMPGLELGRGTGRIREGMLSLRGTFPVGVPLDTVFVPDGWYAALAKSCRLSVAAWSNAGDLALTRDSLDFRPGVMQTSDSSGPEVSFWMDGRRLADGDQVPATFTIRGQVADPAGIMIAPVKGAEPWFYVSDRSSAIDLTDAVLFDDSTSTAARFSVPVQLSGQSDTMYCLVSDNLLNRTSASLVVSPVLSDRLSLESVLVYPNPARRDCRFTFMLSRAADVRVRVFSMAGRHVFDSGLRPGSFGYNEVEWDGRDSGGGVPANGVYLFVVTARTDDGPGKVQMATARDRMLIAR